MKLKVNAQLLNLDGTPMLQGGDHLLLKDACVIALNSPAGRGNGKSPTPEDILTRYRLAQRIYAAPGELDITAEDVVLLKVLGAEVLSVLAFGQMVDLLEGTPAECQPTQS